MEPSAANKGFFQQQPILKNQLHDDVVLQRVIKRVSFNNCDLKTFLINYC